MSVTLGLEAFVLKDDLLLTGPAQTPPEALWQAAMTGAPGHYALYRQDAQGCHHFLRDSLGVHKLFYACTEDGSLHASHYWHHLREAGLPQAAIWSVPPGHHLVLDADGQLMHSAAVAELAIAMDDAAEVDAKAIRRRLDLAFQALASMVGERQVYVALSGGLDSTVIAALARQYLPQVTAVTFAMGAAGSAQASEDIDTATAVAAALDLPFRTVIRSTEEVLAHLDEVLRYGQDFRDFNVHCGLVNATLGAGIAALAATTTKPPLLLTGDTMNELMADYHAECYRGEEFYRLPRLPLAQVRRLLVRGLDAGDREVGIFHHFGLSTLQPYALLAEAYTRLPPQALDGPRAKQELVQAVCGDLVPSLVYDRPKTRAQSGSADNSTGTLAACIDHGWDHAAVLKRFAELYGLRPGEAEAFIQRGRYRFRTMVSA